MANIIQKMKLECNDVEFFNFSKVAYFQSGGVTHSLSFSQKEKGNI